MKKTEMNSIKLVATFDRPADGSLISLNICDIMIQSASTKNGVLTTSETSNSDVENIDKVYLCICDKNEKIADDIIEVPIFESLSREKLVAKAEVPVDKKRKSQVILASAALVLSH